MKQRRRVRLHLIDRPGVSLPSVEGLLVSRHSGEYVLRDPRILLAADAEPQTLRDAETLRIPASNVAFYEVLR